MLIFINLLVDFLICSKKKTESLMFIEESSFLLKEFKKSKGEAGFTIDKSGGGGGADKSFLSALE